jgi:hypothetical protein
MGVGNHGGGFTATVYGPQGLAGLEAQKDVRLAVRYDGAVCVAENEGAFNYPAPLCHPVYFTEPDRHILDKGGFSQDL